MKELNELLGAISGFLWGWPMIVLLLGTHLFLTVRLRFPQRHIFKAIRLSVQKDEGADGDVSQFGALVTAGYNRNRQYCRRRHCNRTRRPGSSFLVLAYRNIGHCHEIRRRTFSHQIQGCCRGREDAGRPEADLWEPE